VIAAAIPITAVVPLQDQGNHSTESRISVQNNVTSPMSQARDTLNAADSKTSRIFKKLGEIDIN